MSIKRMIAVILIFLTAVAGWQVLGFATQLRSDLASGRLGYMVESLWGSSIVQQAPTFFIKIPGSDRVRRVAPAANVLDVSIALEFRKKGLVWYPTFVNDFSGAYTLTNQDMVKQKVQVHFPLPSQEATYDQLQVQLDNDALDIPINTREGVNAIIEIEPSESRVFRVAYRTRGMWSWKYQFDSALGRVRNLDATVRTNFEAIDFPSGTLSPMQKSMESDGMILTWVAHDLITQQGIGMTMPERLNPGPLSTRITFFAPVCLLFFFVLMAALQIVYKVNIHPMHFLFVAAGFFAFHLLFAYLVDLIDIHVAFWLSAVTSVALVIFYLRGALGKTFPWKIAFAGQLFYLVLFSYSFFLQGITGLTVTIGSILTLAVLMRVTAGTDWDAVFGGKPPKIEEKAAIETA